MIKAYLFGAPRFERDGQVLQHARSKGVALLAYLAVNGQPYSREALGALLWPELDSSSVRNNLRRELSLLRSSFGEGVIEADRSQVGLLPGALWVDVGNFRERLQSTSHHHHADYALCAHCEAALVSAVQFYTEDFLSGFNLPDCPQFDEWQFFETETLRQLMGEALQKLVFCYTGRQAYEQAIPLARRWLELDVLHEAPHRALMLLYGRTGQWAAALRQYEHCQQVLAEELGAEPDEETQALYEAIVARRLPDTPTRTLSVEGRLPAFRHNLRPATDPLVGRTNELKAIETYLTSPHVRLVTIVGPGGMGKTRLARACGEEQLSHPERFPDGVFFVPLASLSEERQIYPAIAGAVGFTLEAAGQASRPPAQQVLDYLCQKQLLLILDNFEHLLPGADIVVEILERAQGVKILATSRERLSLREEHILSIQGLDFPAAHGAQKAVSDYTAVQLFVQAARRVHYDFELTAADEAHVGRICRLVYGMPLGVELAASWVDMLPLADIAAEIEQSLDFLEATVRNIPTRQRSLRAVFDTTWQRLTPEEQDTFVRLSVFRGGFTREAGQRITGASLMMLSKLVNKSLVQFNRDKERYEVHELLRQYGAERLTQVPAAAEAAREQHSRYYCQLLHTLQSSIEGADKRTALAAIEADIDNIHAAWDWAVSCCHYERLGQAMSSLEHFYYWRARIHQAEERFRRAMERLAEGLGDHPTVTAERVFAGVQARHANFTTLLGNWDRGKELYQRSLDIIERLLAAGHDVREDKAYLLMKMGDVAESLELAQERFAESLDLYEQVGHTWWCAGLHCHLSYIAIAAGRYEEAQRGFAESLALYQSLGDRWQQGWVLAGMSNVALYQNQLEEAERTGRESLAIHREIGLRDRLADSLATLSWVALAGGKSDEARALYEEAVSIWADLGIGGNGGGDAQPLSPRWFSNVIEQRMAAIVANLPPPLAAEVQARARELDLWRPPNKEADASSQG